MLFCFYTSSKRIFIPCLNKRAPLGVLLFSFPAIFQCLSLKHLFGLTSEGIHKSECLQIKVAKHAHSGPEPEVEVQVEACQLHTDAGLRDDGRWSRLAKTIPLLQTHQTHVGGGALREEPAEQLSSHIE